MSNADTTGQIAYSAKPPCAPFGIATTRRPCHSSVPAPHASTTPMTSMPGLYGSSGRTIMLPPVMRSRSLRLNGIACTLHPHLARLRLGDRHRVELEHLGRPTVRVQPPRSHRAIIVLHLLHLSAGLADTLVVSNSRGADEASISLRM